MTLPPPSRPAAPRPSRWAAAFGAVAAVVVGAGCTLQADPPTVSELEPAWGYNGENTDIEIRGEHFYPTVIVSESTNAGGRIEGTFQAWLERDGEAFRLDEVRHLTYDRLGAEVPAGMETGVYDLRVQVPSGAETVMESAFTVSDTRADHLDLYVTGASYAVGSYAAVTISLEDPTDLAVRLPFWVEVRALPASEETNVADVRFYADGLDDQVPLEEGIGVTGWLGPSGSGVILVTSESESDVRLEVAPVEPGVVRGDAQTLSWQPGPVAEVELTLPRADFRTVAGEPFDLTIRFKDALGNLLTTQPATVLLFDGCFNAITTNVEIVGEGRVPITLTNACPEDRISAYVFDRLWETEPFEVLAADLAGYEVQAAPSDVVAGDDVLVFVEAVDAYGNLITDHVADVVLTDDLGGLDPESGTGTQACDGFAGGAQVCLASLWAAGDAVVITAADADGGQGEAPPIEVRAADAAAVQLRLDATTVTAGQTFGATVRVLDDFGNSVSFDPGGTDPVAFSDVTETIFCQWTGLVSGVQNFDCTVEGAVTDAEVRARVFALAGEAPDPLVVTNGALAEVTLDPQGSSFTAGVAFTIELRGYDAFGNPYVVRPDPLIQLEDTGATMTPSSATFGPSGTAQVSAVVFAAGDAVRVSASQAGVRLGASRLIDVNPAGFDSLDVDIAEWVSVDEPAVVTVTAVDAWGNAVDTYADTVSLTTRGGGCDPVVTSAFEAGRAVVDLTCAAPTLSETLDAVDGDGYLGESAVFDVVDLACANGPTAALELEGRDDAVVCLTTGATVEVDADTAGSSHAGAGIAVRHFSDGESAPVRSLATAVTFTYETTGARTVDVLVVDANACADSVSGTVYVGGDDGEPTGPVAVAVSVASVASIGGVTVDVAATDCTGDVAAWQELLVRADLGTPGGTASGEGLVVSLDGSGEGSFAWDFDSGYSGTATVYVGSVGGGGGGTGTVLVTGDAALPEIVSIDPTGAVAGTVESIDVVFTEAMLARNAGATQIVLTGPAGAVSANYALSTDLETLTITPTMPLDAGSGVYTLAFSTSVRDVAGNQLDGAWTDAPASFSGTFGALAEALPVVSSCEATPEAFTPDGDDGAGADADTVAVTPAATASPAWWWLRVNDASGARVRSVRQPGADLTVLWDGRDDDGMVAPAGTYGLELRAVDTYGNVGGTCDVTVELEQHVDVP